MNSSWNGKVLAVCAACLFFAQIALAQSTAVAPRITQVVDDTKLVTLKGNTHPMARAEFDRGAVSDSLPMERLLLVLQRSDAQESALHSLLDRQQDKTSPSYHKWLTPEQFGQQFGPADADIQTVTNWLEVHGFTVNSVSKGKMIIEFTGTAGLVRDAFHTEIHNYLVNGEKHIANASDPQIPAALAPVVVGVSSLHDFFPKPHYIPSGKTITVPAHSAGAVPHLTAGPGEFFVGPLDFATIYNINPQYSGGNTGSGRTIAVLGVTDIETADLTFFDSVFGLTNHVTTIHNGPDPGDLGGTNRVEATLDVEWSGSIGKGATVDFVVSQTTASTFGTDLSAIYVEDNNLADVMTVSYGACETSFTLAQAQAESQLGEQAAAQGITYMASAGDAGAEDCATSETAPTDGAADFAVDLPGATPFMVAVGGTEFNEGANDSLYWSSSTTADETALSYIPENVWNDSCTSGVGFCNTGQTIIAAGGGGKSIYFPKPSWQAGFSGSPTDTQRDVPDVAFTASPLHDPLIICVGISIDGGPACSSTTDDLQGIGGTSVSTPAFAGIMSIVDQATDSRQGDANYVLYKLAKTETFSACNGSGTPALSNGGNCIFNDATVGNNAVPGETSYGTGSPLYAAGTGYDKATGLGSTNVNNLVAKWNTVSFNSTTTTMTGAPSSATAGQSVTVQISVASGAGTPTGDVSVIATPTSGLGVGGPFATLSGGTASATFTLTAGGTYSVVAHYAGDGNFGPSDSTPATVTVAGGGGGGSGSFSLSASPTSTSVSPGVAATTTITATGSGGFAGSVALSSSVSGPAGAVDTPVCSFTPTSITLSTTTTSGTSSLSCTSTAASQVMYVPSRGPGKPVWAGIGATLAMLCIFFLSWPVRKRRWATAFAFIVLASAAVAVGCSGGGNGGGGGGGNPGTTAGTYTVTVTGTSSSTQTTTLTITVQ